MARDITGLTTGDRIAVIGVTTGAAIIVAGTSIVTTTIIIVTTATDRSLLCGAVT